MKPVEYKWMKPDEANRKIPAGEVCIALYPRFLFPVFVMRNFSSDGFSNMSGDVIDAQPIWVLNMPPIGTGGIVVNMPKDEAD